MEYFYYIFSAVMSVAIAFLYYDRFIARSHLKSITAGDVISLQDFALIERDLKNLKEVIGLSDTVEAPSERLFDAIKDNFTEGVRYRFFISNRNYERDKSTRLKFFHDAEIVAHQISGNKTDHEESPPLTSIINLNYDHREEPYVFLISQAEGKPSEAMCFRGTDKEKGISQEYVFLDPKSAQTMYNLLLQTGGEFFSNRPNQEFVEMSPDKLPLRANRDIVGSNVTKFRKKAS